MSNLENNKDFIYKFEPLWGKWYIDSLIGKGNYGSVYKIKREDWSYEQISAVKVIYVTPNENDIKNLSLEKFDEKSIKNYYEDVVQNIIKEIQILYKLKECINVVSYEDHMVIEGENNLEWIILIRMEYITPLSEYFSHNIFTIENIIQLGIDINSALEACKKQNIMHRDIKEENIFISRDKIFKLGDFGISRELLRSSSITYSKGTPFYMAPESFRGNKYDERVDIYSLGIVMYKLLNHGRMPFLPSYPKNFTEKDRKIAFEDRMSGKSLSPPACGDENLKNIVLKACMYNPKYRYQSAVEMKSALIICLNTLSNSRETINSNRKDSMCFDKYSEKCNELETELINNEFFSSKGSINIKEKKKKNNLLWNFKHFVRDYKKSFIIISSSLILIIMFFFTIYNLNLVKAQTSTPNNDIVKPTNTNDNKISFENTPVVDTNELYKNDENSFFDIGKNADINSINGITTNSAIPETNNSPTEVNSIIPENDDSLTELLTPSNLVDSPKPTVLPFAGIWSGNITNINTQNIYYVNITITNPSANNVNIKISKQNVESEIITITETGTSVIEDDKIIVITKSYVDGKIYSRSQVTIVLNNPTNASVRIIRRVKTANETVSYQEFTGNLEK